MRLATLTSVALLLSASCALAQGTSNTMTSGRPSAVLDDATCQTIWQMASPNGATISQDQAVPYIVNFKMVDVDGDGAISAGVQGRLRQGACEKSKALKHHRTSNLKGGCSNDTCGVESGRGSNFGSFVLWSRASEPTKYPTLC